MTLKNKQLQKWQEFSLICLRMAAIPKKLAFLALGLKLNLFLIWNINKCIRSKHKCLVRNWVFWPCICLFRGHFSNHLNKTMIDDIDNCLDNFTLKSVGKIGMRQHHCILLFCCGLVYSSSGIISATTVVREWLMPFLESCPILPFYYIFLWRFGHRKLTSNTSLQTKVVEGIWNKHMTIVKSDFSNLVGSFRFN